MKKWIINLVLSTFVIALGSSAAIQLDKMWLHNILNKKNKDLEIKRIISMNHEPIDSCNFNNKNSKSSLITNLDEKINMEIQLKDGEMINDTLIVRSLPNLPALKEKTKEGQFFDVEIKVYRDVISKMEKLLADEYDNNETIVWVKAFDFHENDQLVFEDIEALGYRKVDKSVGLDKEHSLLAIKTLAKFHALSAIIIDRNATVGEEFKESYIQRLSRAKGDAYSAICYKLADVIESDWNKDWRRTGDRIREITPEISGKLIELLEHTDKLLNVLNVGSPHIGNMYFKYDEQSRPISMRLSNFQTVFYNSPTYDVQYFLNTNPNLNVTANDKPELIAEYHETLLDYLKKFNYTKNVPHYEHILWDVSRLELYGLVSGITVLPDLFDKSGCSFVNDRDGNDDYSGMYSNQYHVILQLLLNEALNNNVI